MVNHNAPSGPEVIATGLVIFGSVKLETDPPVVIRPIDELPRLVNHNAPSGPDVMRLGLEMLGSV